ncbi:MAG: hypothetical protein MZV70_02575 [Desulfobacterales bacterium]|nr:hypothetical protein [Desulfobacterales bacterium]
MWELISQIRWQDVLDIVLVSIILHRLLLLIKGTKAAKMIAGLGILLVASIVSKFFELDTMEWMVQSFLAQVVIGIIILFQPEIWKALAQMGETSFLKNLTSAESCGPSTRSCAPPSPWQTGRSAPSSSSNGKRVSMNTSRSARPSMPV